VTVRVIARLDVKGPNLVKGIHLEGLRVLGKPERYARLYYEAGADELLFMDAVASLYGRNHLAEIISRVAKNTFVPLCVGGGLRSLDDVRAVLRSGADKVAINTQAIKQPEFIKAASAAFGSSTIVVALEVIRQPNGLWQCFTDSGREATGIEAVGWAQKVAELGAGEILLTSVDREGTGKGFDLEITRRIAEAVPIPVIAHGGAGSAADIIEVVAEGRADAVCVSSLLHYNALQQIDWTAADFGEEGNIEFIRQKRLYSKVQDTDIVRIKAALARTGIDVRPALANTPN
jgi:cyclase